jgi:AcrR family transcriptional regulator
VRQHRRNAAGHHRDVVAGKVGRGPRMPAAERRQAVLETACRVFSRRSYRGVTTAEIAHEAGVSEPILYRHFSSKRDLYIACLDLAWRRLQARFESAIADQDDPKAAFGGIVKTYFAGPERGMLVNLWIQALTEAAEEPEIRRFLRRQMREVHDYVAEEIRRAQAVGAVHADRDPGAEAWIFLAGGLLLRAVDHRLGGLLRDGDIQRVMQERQKWMAAEPEPETRALPPSSSRRT